MMVEIAELTQAGGRSYCATTPIWPKARRVWLHHTWSPTSAQYRGLSTVQAIQRYHVQERGFSDIGYGFLVAPDGTCFNGRPMNVMGAHVKGHNQDIGVACIANFDTEDPWQWRGMGQLRACVNILLGRMGVGPEAVFFHRDAADKSCPGTRLDRAAFRSYLTQQPLGPPLVDAAHPRVVLLPGSELVDCHAVVEGGVTRCDLRPLAEALGFVVVAEHLATDGKLYLRGEAADG